MVIALKLLSCLSRANLKCLGKYIAKLSKAMRVNFELTQKSLGCDLNFNQRLLCWLSFAPCAEVSVMHKV